MKNDFTLWTNERSKVKRKQKITSITDDTRTSMFLTFLKTENFKQLVEHKRHKMPNDDC